MSESKLDNIIAIVNDGYSDYVMECAKDKGARGGTIISANGSVSKDAGKLYGVDVHPGKEIILILVKKELAPEILKVLYEKCGVQTPSCGIFFSLPVTHASENLINQYK